MAKLKGFITGCDSKPSPVQHLADEGELVYDYSKRTPDKVSAKRTKTFTAVAERDVDETDFSETFQAIDNEMESVPHATASKKRRAGGPEPKLTPGSSSGEPKVVDEQKALLSEVRTLKNKFVKIIDESHKNLLKLENVGNAQELISSKIPRNLRSGMNKMEDIKAKILKLENDVESTSNIAATKKKLQPTLEGFTQKYDEFKEGPFCTGQKALRLCN